MYQSVLHRDTTALNCENNTEHTKHAGTYTPFKLKRFKTTVYVTRLKTEPKHFNSKCYI